MTIPVNNMVYNRIIPVLAKHQISKISGTSDISTKVTNFSSSRHGSVTHVKRKEAPGLLHTGKFNVNF